MRVPPGRAGKRWVDERLAVAHRGEEVLEEKVRALRGEERRLRRLVDDTQTRWDEAARDARTWHERAMLLGGERQHALADAARPFPARVAVRWRTTMGVAYPAEARAVLPDPRRAMGVGRTAAFAFAVQAHHDAVEAAVQHAAASRAHRVVADELEATRRRLRGIRDRWIPRLVNLGSELELGLAEAEREDAVRARWAREQRAGGVNDG